MKRSHYSVTEQGATLPLPTHSRLPPHSSSQYAEIQSHHVPAHIPTSFADAIPRNPVSKDQVDQVIHNQQLVQQTQHAQQAQQAQQAQHAQHAQVAGSYQVQHDPYRQPVSGVYTPQSYYTPSPEQHYLPNVQLNYPQYTFPFDAGFQGYPTESDFEDTLQECVSSPQNAANRLPYADIVR